MSKSSEENLRVLLISPRFQLPIETRTTPQLGIAYLATLSERAEAQKLLEIVFREYRSNQVVSLATSHQASQIPLLYGRTQRDGLATAYVRQHFACQLPVKEPNALATQLNG